MHPNPLQGPIDKLHVVAGWADSALAARRSVPSIIDLIGGLEPRGGYALAVVEVPLPSVRCVFELADDADRLAAVVEAAQTAAYTGFASEHAFTLSECRIEQISRDIRRIRVGAMRQSILGRMAAWRPWRR